MPVGISVEKDVLWRGAPERFASVYHYDISPGLMSDDDWNSMVDVLVTRDKHMHANTVNYRTVRVWGPTYDPKTATPEQKAASYTRFIKDLSGTGSIAAGAGFNIPHEMTVVCSWYIGRNPATGRKRFLRKYFHSLSTPLAVSEGVVRGAEAMSTALIEAFATRAENLKNIPVFSTTYAICAPNGDRLPLGTNVKVLPHLHTRQFKQ